MTRSAFGKTSDGKTVDLFTLTNAGGMEMRVITFGGTILSLRAPDRNGQLDDIVLGFEDVAGYETKSPYFGAIIGRSANRIARGRFTLDGKVYQLATNNGPNHLHGGVRGLDKVVWQAAEVNERDRAGVVFTYTSPDGEEGYPGTVHAQVTYMLTNGNELLIDYEASADKATPLNLTHHSYFNLAGDGKRDVLGHQMTINAETFTPIDPTGIPTGAIVPVAGTPFDFRTPTEIGARINNADEQLKNGIGYDHNFVLKRTAPGLVEAARVVEPVTGRILEILTTEPGIQFYSGNFLDGTITGKSGRIYNHRFGFCLEPQHFPDSPNRPEFPSTIVRPGQTYRSQTVFRFSALGRS